MFGWGIAVALISTIVFFLDVKGVWTHDASYPHYGVLIPGDSEAVDRDFFDLFNPKAQWRTEWKWVLLKTSTGSIIHYRSGGMQEKFSKWLRTQYVALRVGPDNVHFWATEGGIGGSNHEVVLSQISTVLSKEELWCWCNENHIDPGMDVSWI
jgi:hypothetical protein